MHGGRWWLGWWAVFAVLTLLLARTHAGETRAELRVSATVVHSCRVALSLEPGARRADLRPRVDCGTARAEEAPSYREERCDHANRAAWCVRLLERHPGAEIRRVRFD